MNPTATATASSACNNKKSLTTLEKLILQHVQGAAVGTLNITFPSGHTTNISKTPQPAVEWHITTDQALRDIAVRGALGFGEAFVDGGWTTPDLTKLLYFFLENAKAMQEGFRGKRSFFTNLFFDMGQRLLQFKHRNSKSGSKRNILAHYDLSNKFYEHWLDASMTYSSAIRGPEGETLEQQQTRKYQRILDQLNPEPDGHILEIGCGWGGFAEHATQQGFKVTGITISDAQYNFAKKRLKDQPNVNIIIQDYRTLEGRFDHVVSIEMIEAVGRKYWPTYFNKIKSVLKPGGKAVLQSILIDDQYYDDYKNSIDFIQAYIFPGGFLPTTKTLEQQAKKAYLQVTDQFDFGLDYAYTLNKWQQDFLAKWPEIQQLDPKFNNRFQRLWQYYLSYCEAGFLNRRIDVAQVTLEHTKI